MLRIVYTAMSVTLTIEQDIHEEEGMPVHVMGTTHLSEAS